MYVKWLVLRHKCAFFPHFTEKIGADFVQITFKPKKAPNPKRLFGLGAYMKEGVYAKIGIKSTPSI